MSFCNWVGRSTPYLLTAGSCWRRACGQCQQAWALPLCCRQRPPPLALTRPACLPPPCRHSQSIQPKPICIQPEGMDKLREIDWRGLAKTATQKVKKYTLNLTDLEIKVEDATNSETWGEPAARRCGAALGRLPGRTGTAGSRWILPNRRWRVPLCRRPPRQYHEW